MSLSCNWRLMSFFQFHWSIIGKDELYILSLWCIIGKDKLYMLRCTMWSFNIHMHQNIIMMTKLISILIGSVKCYTKKFTLQSAVLEKFVCVWCVFVCTCVCVGHCRCAHIYINSSDPFQVFSFIAPHLDFWGRVFYWPWCFLFWKD